MDPDEFRLSAIEHQAIFDQRIKPYVFSAAQPSSRPVAIVFGGQPGAGKSAAIGFAKLELHDRGGAIEIIGDKLRDFHPLYSRLVGLDDKTAAFYTDRDTGLWIEKSITEAARLRVSVVIEGTMRDSDKVAANMKMLRAVGFEIDARALAVHHRLSAQGILMRYEGQKLDRGSARMTTAAAHQAGYDGLPITLSRIESEKLADRISVLRRGGEAIYSNHLVGGEWARAPLAHHALETERQRPLTTAEVVAYVKGFEALVSQLNRPDRMAGLDEIHRIHLLRHEASAMLVESLTLNLSEAKGALNVSGQVLAQDRAQAFEKLPMLDALARFPELDGAYKTLYDAKKVMGSEDANLRASLTDQLRGGQIPTANVSFDDSRKVLEMAAEFRGLRLSGDAPSPASQTQGEVIATSTHHALIHDPRRANPVVQGRDSDVT